MSEFSLIAYSLDLITRYIFVIVDLSDLVIFSSWSSLGESLVHLFHKLSNCTKHVGGIFCEIVIILAGLFLV